MLKNGERSCDVCYRAIRNDDKYIQRKILKQDLPPVLKSFDDMLTVDAQGNVEIDICLDCASITGVSGDEN